LSQYRSGLGKYATIETNRSKDEVKRTIDKVTKTLAQLSLHLGLELDFTG
jgi:hypothetical protein